MYLYHIFIIYRVLRVLFIAFNNAIAIAAPPNILSVVFPDKSENPLKLFKIDSFKMSLYKLLLVLLLSLGSDTLCSILELLS